MTKQEAINQLYKMAVTDRDYDAVKVATEAMTCGEWISVNDRLPDESEEYIVMIKGGAKATTLLYDGDYWFEESGNKTVYYTVTHWMPMPQPPKEE